MPGLSNADGTQRLATGDEKWRYTTWIRAVMLSTCLSDCPFKTWGHCGAVTRNDGGKIQLMQWLAVAAILAMVCAAVGGSQSKTGREDPLLEKLIGKWTITRKFPNRTVTNTAECAWVLQHQYVKIHMKDTAQPSQYEAEIFIGYDEEKKRYVAHWIDVFGGGFSATLGFGTKKGNQIEFEFKYPDGELKNTFTWHEDSNTWTSEIIQQDEKGTWVPFCTDTYRRT